MLIMNDVEIPALYEVGLKSHRKDESAGTNTGRAIIVLVLGLHNQVIWSCGISVCRAALAVDNARLCTKKQMRLWTGYEIIILGEQ